MTFFEDVFATEPEWINPENGMKFWIDKKLTKYAKTLGLENIRVLIVLEPNGRKTRLIVEGTQPIYENQSLETIAYRLDLMKLIKERS